MRLTAVLRVREFRGLWLAELLSVGGDQLARVAVAVLVYRQTGSATWTTLSYAMTFLPNLLGSVFLASLADRFRRRELIVATDLCRALLAAVMAVPGLPLPVLGVLVALLSFAGGPFKAAQLSLMYQVLGQHYVQGLSIRTISTQLAQLVGFAAGGAVLTIVSPYAVLAFNAATFVMAAVMVWLTVNSRPGTDRTRSTTGVARMIWRDPVLRSLIVLAWMVGLFVVPEGLAAPYADELMAGVAAVGFLMAADPAGSIIGAWLSGRMTEQARERMLVPFAILAGVPLILCFLQPGVLISVVLWGISGVASTAYLIETQAAFVKRVPEYCRGTAVGLGSAGVQASQGVAIALGGVVADAVSPSTAVALAGLSGAGFAALVGVSWLRARQR
ncbi:Predicted arabinose efflux permease, MFS family [Kibdelosporangium aridum]|uniref:Predicted arabinose efflux permease, MFS family n=1 Tax=Kibdelosporangium aridum TaxID=2030 RepID=A0A1Y5WXN1_KIBAR|nr:Predicted arabinose efflux permease, MFS family [Kibdelosporangium aridum]